jgi:hypothetical protein
VGDSVDNDARQSAECACDENEVSIHGMALR